MLERIKSQIKEIDEILEKIKTLDETAEQLLKENKYAKKITGQYFKENENIIKTIKDTKTLIKELKNNYIKLTEEQKEKEKLHKTYIEELKKSLEKIRQILKKLETEKTYIDNEIIDILDLNEIEDLKQIIEFNKVIKLKKNGDIIKKREQKQVEEKTVKKEEKKEKKEIKEVTKNIPVTIKANKKKEKIQKPEKIIIFKNMIEINEHLKTTYDIEIETEKTEQELNDMIEILENEPFEITDGNLIKHILENSNLIRLKEINGYIKETEDDTEKIKLVKDIYEVDRATTIFVKYLLYNDIPTEKKLELFSKSKERKTTIAKNIVLLKSIGLEIFPLDLLMAKIDDEQIEQVIELGHMFDLIKINRMYTDKRITDIQFKEMLERKVFDNIKKYFISMVSQVNNDEQMNLKKFSKDYTNIIKSIKKGENIEKTLKQFCNIVNKANEKNKNKTQTTVTVVDQKPSRNPILMKEKEISEYSKENFTKTYISFQRPENPINKLDNKYLSLIEKYTNQMGMTYSIPIKKCYCKNGKIEISRNKVSRLINAHILKGDEITAEVVKQCMLYNLVITEELLQELDRILTEQFKMLDQKQKKY